MKVSFLGLGVMGYPMAGHLAKAGYEVTVFNRNTEKATKWATEYRGKLAESPKSAATEADIIFACVGNDEDSLNVGQAAISAAMQGSLYVDHTTTSASCAEKLHSFAQTKGVGFIDAPVSGGEAGAVNGALSIMCGSAAEDLARASHVMEAYAKRIVHIGPVGHGQLCKAANQIAIAGLVQALSEAVHFTTKTGIDSDKVLDAISGGAAQSWQMENRWKTMVQDEFDFGFAVDWMRKDLSIVAHEAERVGATLPVTQIVSGYYDKVSENGGNRYDTSSLLTLLQRKTTR